VGKNKVKNTAQELKICISGKGKNYHFQGRGVNMGFE
jgi:hypothetical protein